MHISDLVRARIVTFRLLYLSFHMAQFF